jgi:flavin-dependent dehydrogenase
MNQLKIAVIGCGPAGSFSAFLLKGLGHDIYLFDKKTSVKRKLCGEYLTPLGIKILEKYQVLAPINKLFNKLEGMVLVDAKNNIIIPSRFPVVDNFSYGLSVNRQILDEYFLDLAKNIGVNIRLNHLLKEINPLKEGHELTFNEGEKKIFDLVIAADGINSLIAQKLKHITPSKNKRIAIHTYIPKTKDQNFRMGEMHIFEDGSYCGINPISTDEVNFSIVIDSDEIRSENQGLQALLNKRIKNSKRLEEFFLPVSDSVEIKTSMPLSNNNSFIAGNNLAYVGDASGFVDPLTGEGLTNALLSADLLYQSMLSSKCTNDALKKYKKRKLSTLKSKRILNRIFQSIIRTPILVTFIGKFLYNNEKRSSAFIGIIGNIYSPLKGLIKLIF